MKNYKEIFEDEVNFYYMNLSNGYKTNKKAKKNLVERTNGNYKLLCSLKNYDEIGIVEFVADDEFSIDYKNLIIEIDE